MVRVIAIIIRIINTKHINQPECNSKQVITINMALRIINWKLFKVKLYIINSNPLFTN